MATDVMPKNRLEAFSDGVIAIIITIMVLELKAPNQPTFAALRPLLPVFLSYLLSFIYVAIYWNNHHLLMHAAGHVNAKMMWANLHLLFWLSLVPFVTSWVGENNDAPMPSALYGAVLLMAGWAYLILQSLVIASRGKDSALAKAVGKNWKGKISMISYAAAIALSFVNQSISDVLYIAVAAMWFIPDRRFALN